jgi:hypothetical protein
MHRIVFVTVFMFFVSAGISQMVPEGIILACKKGDARELSTFFHSNIELQILNETQITSRNQAARIMQDFFNKYPPVSFEVNYEDFKLDTKYGLGTLVSEKESFRINLYFMEVKKKKYIYYLNIEKI